MDDVNRKIKELYLQGYPIWQIAKALGVSEAYVVKIVRPRD